MKVQDLYLFYTEMALLSIKLRSTTFDAFSDAEHSPDLKIKRLGLKWKTDSLIKHDQLLDMRDKRYEMA